MGYLDNNSILIDATLTQHGRRLLAQGRLRVVQFAFADDEINYALYNTAAALGYEDATLLETPILEAFASGEGSMKNLLYSLDRDDVFYLSVIKAYTSPNTNWAQFVGGTTGVARYVVAVDKETLDAILSGQSALPAGVQDGVSFTTDHAIRTDQGIDTPFIPQSTPPVADQIETQYILQLDNRLGSIITPAGQNPGNLPKNFIDNDNIATYTATLGVGTNTYVIKLEPPSTSVTSGTSIDGPLGTSLRFRLKATDALRTSNSLFNRLGSSTLDAIGGAAIGSLQQISTTLQIRGFQTGYRVSVPVDFVKKV